jgi:CheY-like chemotaxis protein
MKKQPIILIVDDGPGDRRLMQEALEEKAPACRVEVSADGNEALELVYNRPELRPDLIFLDLNMPRKDGREVLVELKSNPNYCEIPIVVVTTSDSSDDILFCYRNHANSVLTKPLDIDNFVKAIEEVVHYWIYSVQVPGFLTDTTKH